MGEILMKNSHTKVLLLIIMKTNFIYKICLFSFIYLIAISSNAMAFDLSSPRATLHSFVGSYNQGKLQQAALCVAGTDPDKINLLAELAKARKSDETSEIIINKLDITIDDSGKTADAAITLQIGKLKDEFHDSPNQFISHLKLNSQDGKWKIIADEFKYKHTREIRDPLSYIVSLLAHPESIEIIHQHARIATCQSNLKQLSLTVFMFEQDHNNIYTFTNKTWIESLKPYMTAVQRPILICPDDKSPYQHSNGNKASYSFNANLVNVSAASIQNPSQVVLFYEGKDGKLNFRHNSEACVAFVDGSTKLVNRKDAGSLRWKP